MTDSAVNDKEAWSLSLSGLFMVSSRVVSPENFRKFIPIFPENCRNGFTGTFYHYKPSK